MQPDNKHIECLIYRNVSLLNISINQGVNHNPLVSWHLFWYICDWQAEVKVMKCSACLFCSSVSRPLCPSETLSWYSAEIFRKQFPRTGLRGQEAGMSMEEPADCSHALRKWGVGVSVPAGAVASGWRGQNKLSHIWQLEQVNKFMGSCDDLLSVLLTVARHYRSTTGKRPHLRQAKRHSGN